MIEIDIILINGTRLCYTTAEAKVSEHYMRFKTDDNTGVGIPIANILYWEIHEK